MGFQPQNPEAPQIDAHGDEILSPAQTSGTKPNAPPPRGDLFYSFLRNLSLLESGSEEPRSEPPRDQLSLIPQGKFTYRVGEGLG